LLKPLKAARRPDFPCLPTARQLMSPYYFEKKAGRLTESASITQLSHGSQQSWTGSEPPEQEDETTMDPDKRSAFARKLDEECPYQVVLPRRGSDETAILDFLSRWVSKFDMYVEDDYAVFVRYCFEDPLDAAVFRSRFEPKVERLKLAS
jgi:hypothetical protein